MNDSKRLNIRLSDEANEALDALITDWKCGQTAAVERAIIEAQTGLAMRNAVFETLELMQSLPDTMREVFEDIAESTPKQLPAIPGVQQGYAGIQQPRESSADRVARERREREERARARSSVGDDPSYSFEPEYVQD